MYTAKIQNNSGQLLILTDKESQYQVIDIQGLNPVTAQVNTTKTAGMDGAKFNSATLNTRNIVITIKINGDVEKNRLFLYRMFRPKEACIFYYSNDTLDVSIVGVVETVECGLFTKDERAQISIECFNPYFRAITPTKGYITNVNNAVEFPITFNEPLVFSSYVTNNENSIINNSDSPTGLVFTINFIGSVKTFTITNTDTGDFFTMTKSGNGYYVKGDQITIDTNSGQRSVRLTRSGTTTSIFGEMTQGSTFFELKQGVNHFTYSADNNTTDDNMIIAYSFNRAFGGV
ncbi:MAG: phage tail family protein [Ruminococcus sp.]|nr:phage tail family protein [Ruminococcus sp.]